MSILRHNIINNATFNGTVTSPVLSNDGRVVWVLIVRTGAVTTTPTLTPAVNVSVDGVNFVQAGPAITAISTASTNRYVYAVNSTQGPIAEPSIQVVCTFGGSGSFANTSVDLIGIGFYD